ncbi:hypothetical protein HMPREF1983_00950 [Gemella bergeri ATCC 700627]|uniref:YopX protein domain-containing protein n=1 Tax=Gemella bergeri ATCC 700627 TaxID=1321820 RepID=U2S4Y4_9BACL|nr:YopX family protein [Gemella bergeri]ERK57847.1 hypothetical protein HMPREF1983_00950 [Gemella bergeri ATCC 700627]
MNIPNLKAFVDNKIYNVIGWNGDYIILSRRYENSYIQSLNVKKNDVVLMLGSSLVDRKGNEIFSGDIVKNSDKDMGIVRFKEGCFEVDFKEYIPNVLGLVNDDLEIIGNVHKNKSLLEKITQVNTKKSTICLNNVERRLSKKRKRASK